MMKTKLRSFFSGTSLAGKIRAGYFIILVPLLILTVAFIINMHQINDKYGRMFEAAGAASEFSIDFEEDFNYETYLLIVENKSLEDSQLDVLLNEAGRVIETLKNIGTSSEQAKRLEAVEQQLEKLRYHKERIEENLRIGNHYEENYEIWENDVQIVTYLISEYLFSYIYNEITEMRESREEYNRTYTTTLTIMVILFIVITVVSFMLSYFIPKSITKPIKDLCEVTNSVAGGNLAVRADANAGAEVGVLSDSLNIMIDKINELLSQVTTEQTRLRKAEFELLQAQINPHFLYNTLDTIVWLAEAGENMKVVEMVRNLSDFFRISLNQGKEEVTLREEIQHVGSYLKIQQVRYMDILEYEINVPEELMECGISKITLQPLVENALYHGIKNKRGKGKITISGLTGGDGAIIKISDNGIGMTEERLKEVRQCLTGENRESGDIYGLYNVNERIALRYGKGYGIEIASIYGEGTILTVKLPLNTEK